MKYMLCMERKLLKNKVNLPSIVKKKWEGVLPPLFKLRWKNTWDKERARKEARVIWMIWHKAMAVNAWGDAISAQIGQSYLIYMVGAKKLILHKFLECPIAQQAWKW